MSEPRHTALAVPYVAQPERTHQLVYHEWGDSENPRVVLCMHGLTRNGRDFDFLARALERNFRVIALDMPGRGKSQWLNDGAEYNTASYMANLTYVLDTLKLPAVYWLGTSMGGILGMMMAAAQPARVRALCLNDVGAWIPAAALRRLGEYVGVQTQFPGYAAAEKALREAYAPFGLTDLQHWRHLFAHSLEESPDGGVRTTYDPAIGAPFREEDRIQDIDLWAVWGKITCPTLLLRGGMSDLFPEATALRMLGSRAGVNYHTFPNIGHAPMLMEPGQINIVRNWLERLS